jgi:GT2 family glycosyltransferase
MDRFRRAYDRDGGASGDRRTLASTDVLGCTGAVALLRRAMLDDVAVDGQVLDEQIFAYYDDLDLAWRAVLRGWACRYEPRLTATHHRMARNAIRGLANRPTRLRDQLLSVRNRLLVMARCDRPGDFVRALPWLLPFELARVVYLAIKAPRVLRAYVEAAQALPAAFGARARIHGRVVSPALPPLPWKVR